MIVLGAFLLVLELSLYGLGFFLLFKVCASIWKTCHSVEQVVVDVSEKDSGDDISEEYLAYLEEWEGYRD